MNVHFYSFYCEICGCVPQNFQKIGVTSNREILVLWKCVRCGYEILCVLPIQQIIAHIPATNEQLETEDLRWLNEINQGFRDSAPEEGETN